MNRRHLAVAIAAFFAGLVRPVKAASKITIKQVSAADAVENTMLVFQHGELRWIPIPPAASTVVLPTWKERIVTGQAVGTLTFTLLGVPRAGSLTIHKNGLIQDDFTLAGAVVTLGVDPGSRVNGPDDRFLFRWE